MIRYRLLNAGAIAQSIILFSIILSVNAASESNTVRAQKFVDAHVAKFKPLDKASAIANWDAYTTGKDEDFKRKEAVQNAIDAALSDPAKFAELKAIKQAGEIGDPLLARQVELLYLTYLEKQIDPALLQKMVEKSSGIEKAFNVFRPKVDGKELSENQVRKTLKESTSSEERRKAWEASKAVGPIIQKDLIELAKLRNQAASKLGFGNFHVMQLALNEQDQAAVIKLFDELDQLTREPYHNAKAEIDEVLAKNCGINVQDLRPWHYQDPFCQESPSISGVDLDSIYAPADVLKICREFYSGIGLPIDDVIARSDLYEKAGKSSHAFCFDIDREGDVRVLANIQPDEYWMGTMLHELGHAVYSSKNMPSTLPYLLRTEAHMLTTEGIAMMFGRLSKLGQWQVSAGVAPADAVQRAQLSKASGKALRNGLLIFSRWCQVMLRFEKGLYENPDQDLNKLWWDLVERYQEVRRPEGRNAPDYATKIHVVSYPVYYHNYMMGELFASQVHHAICRDVLNGASPPTANYAGKPEVGAALRAKVFGPGRRLSWNELTRQATGEPLNAKAFAEDLKSF